MKCHVCGSEMKQHVTDLPFKRGDNCIIIVKDLPVIQCKNCGEYILEDKIMEWVEKALKSVGQSAELEIVRYAA